MATARKTTKEVTTTETVYTLELSEEDACSLQDDLKHESMKAGELTPGWVLRILAALESVGGDPAPLAVGDRVRVFEPDSDYTGRVGTLVRIDQADGFLPCLVAFDDGDCWWTKGVERA